MTNKFLEDSITFKDDLFNREHYANTLISLIKDETLYKESSSTVIALDSPWGSGKTTFVKMLKNKIINEENDISCVVYNRMGE